MIYFVVIALIGLYASGLYYWHNKVEWRLKTKPSKGIKRLHFLGASFCLGLGVLHIISSLSLASYLAIRIMLGFTLVTGITMNIIAHKSVFKNWESYYFWFFSILPLLVLGLLLFPFLGIVLALSFVGWFTGPEDQIYYEDSTIRVTSFFAGPLGPPHLGIYEKKGWLEKDHTIPNIFASQTDSVQVRYDTDSTRILIFNNYYIDKPGDYPPQILSIERIK